jgi:hypothetical protein
MRNVNIGSETMGQDKIVSQRRYSNYPGSTEVTCVEDASSHFRFERGVAQKLVNGAATRNYIKYYYNRLLS